MNVISTYQPQVGLYEILQEKYWEELSMILGAQNKGDIYVSYLQLFLCLFPFI